MKKIFSIILAIFFIIHLLGFIADGNVKNGNVKIKFSPQKIKISDLVERKNPINQSSLNNNNIVLSSENVRALPLLSSLFKHRDIEIYVDWGVGEHIEFEDISLFSSELALRFWDECETAIVVDSYKNALLASQITSFLDIPILFYGSTSEATIQELKTESIIEIGETPLEGDVVFLDQQDVIEYTLGLAQNLSIFIDYLVVTNPSDQHFQVENLSAFSSMIATYRNGIICYCTNDSLNVDQTIKNTYELFETYGMTLKYICLVGEPSCVPFSHIEVVQQPDMSEVATDNLYADFDGDPLVPEIAVGRLLAKDLQDISRLFDRYVNYESYFDEKLKKMSNWQSTAWSWAVFPQTISELLDPIVLLAKLGEWKSVFSVKKTFEQAGFRTLPCFAFARLHSSLNYASDSNFIFITGLHGYPYGIYPYGVIGQNNTPRNFHPATMFIVSCSVGRTDNVTLNQTVTCSFLHEGLAAYIAPTRSASGGGELFGTANLLGRLFFEHLVQNITVGEALIQAKKDYYLDQQQKNFFDEGIEVTLYEYALYGDPAFNPYEPNNKG